MERKMVSIGELKKVLSPKEMKNVLGGSTCCCGMGPTTQCADGVDMNWVLDNCWEGIGGCFG